MEKVYLLRHDSLGLLDAIFTRPPTDAELASILAELAKQHGVGPAKYNDPTAPNFVGENHPFHGERWQLHVEARPIVDPSDLAKLIAEARKPKAEPASDGAKGEAGTTVTPKITAARGEVRNPSQAMSISGNEVGTLKV